MFRQIIILLFIFIYQIDLISQDINPILKIGLVSDPQYCDCPNDLLFKRYYRNSIFKLNECIKTFNEKEVDFVISLGDIIDRDYESYDTMIPIYDKLEMEVFHTLGNHDYYIEDTLKKNVLEKLNLEENYYSFIRLNWEFIILDGTELAEYTNYIHQNLEEEYLEMRNEIEGEINDKNFNGGISDKQLEWLEDRLLNAELNNRRVIVCSHFNIFPYGTNHNLYNSRELKELLDKYKVVKGYINGHFHSGKYVEDNDKFYFNLVGMVHTEENNSYSIMEIYEDRIEIIGYGLIANQSIKMSIDIESEGYKKELNVYPNPVENKFKLMNLNWISTSNSYTYYIYDFSGKIFQKGKLISPHQDIFVRNIIKGNYIIEIESGKESIFGRFYKK